jgi:hypothetical protein
MNHFLYSSITLCMALFFALLGLIGVLLPWSEAFRGLAVKLILDYTLLMFLFGLSCLCIAFATAFNIIINMKRRYYHFKVAGGNVSVDSELLQNYLHTYLKELFPQSEIPYQLALKKNKIHITLDLPYIEPSKQSELLKRIQTELKQLLTSFMGYHHHFHLAASFQPAPHES